MPDDREKQMKSFVADNPSINDEQAGSENDKKRNDRERSPSRSLSGKKTMPLTFTCECYFFFTIDDASSTDHDNNQGY